MMTLVDSGNLRASNREGFWRAPTRSLAREPAALVRPFVAPNRRTRQRAPLHP
jgi:hypothetical protein